jgi:hypothetical protein
VDAQTVDCGQDTLQTYLAGSAIDLAILTTNGRQHRTKTAIGLPAITSVTSRVASAEFGCQYPIVGRSQARMERSILQTLVSYGVPRDRAAGPDRSRGPDCKPDEFQSVLQVRLAVDNVGLESEHAKSPPSPHERD